MKIRSLSLENFRRYYGVQRLLFSTDDKKNVTLVIGNNSFGKSTLFQAIYWLFLGETQDRAKFEAADLINAVAQREGKSEFSVEAEIEVDNKIFSVRRSQRVSAVKLDPKLTIFEVPSSGSHRKLSDDEASKLISAILPRSMADYFFIHGEDRAKKDFSATSKNAVSKGISSILGCDTVETLVDDLEQVRRDYDRLCADSELDDNLKKMRKNLEAMKTEREQAGATIDECYERMDELDAQINKLDEKLAANRNSEQYESRRRQAIRLLEEKKRDLHQIKLQKKLWVRNRAIAIVSHTIVENGRDKIDDEIIKGKLPGNINEVFIRQLLTDKKCVCGRKIDEHSEAERHLLEAINTQAENPELVEVCYEVKGLFSGYLSEQNSAREAIVDYLEREKLTNLEIGRLEDEIIKLDALLEGVDVEEVRRLQADRKEKETQRKDLLKRAERGKASISVDLSPGIKALEKVIEENERKTGRVNEVKIRAEFVQRIIDELKGEIQSYKTESKNKILTYVNAVIKEMYNDYRVDIDDKFNLELVSVSLGKPLQRSSGEDQLVALAYISGLIRFCSERAKIKSTEGEPVFLPGTVAPLFLDAPFSPLDQKFRAVAAKAMAAQAQQVVLLLTPNAFREVEEHLRDSLGNAAILRLVSEKDISTSGEQYAFLNSQYEAVEAGSPEHCKLVTIL